eukprot:gnl/TRDRNA2_/TRDRNA2_80759_c0_seq2.p1 gnl/TRDRNA2_/TRDRNA2_80759_c0~~gnl/TRDRNA2_/TRDRNA2_80759_c0_seq2.p1  ORF type:complete len:173 (+),score=27.25 gnl/TRDRNA2_/TRDRNA2_80759_c0_seq2:283-801(+)
MVARVGEVRRGQCTAPGLSAVAVDVSTGQLLGVVTAEDFADTEVPTAEFRGAKDPVAELLATLEATYRAKYGLEQTVQKGQHLHIWTMGVRPEARGRHIAEHLLAFILETARQRGFHRAFAETSGNRALHIFRDKLGFKEIRRADHSSLPASCPLAQMEDRGQAIVEISLER